MAEDKRRQPQEVAGSAEHEELHNEDFQFVLKALLAAYQPILEEELRRAKAPEDLKKEVESRPGRRIARTSLRWPTGSLRGF